MQMWIGLAKVTTADHNQVLNGATKAYVTVVGLSTTRLKFRNAIVEELNGLGIMLERLENAETLKERKRKFEVPEPLQKLIHQTGKKNKQIGFLPFHTYD